jgi:hypothetical protein
MQQNYKEKYGSKKIQTSLKEMFHSYDYEVRTGENKTDRAKSSTLTKYGCHPTYNTNIHVHTTQECTHHTALRGVLTYAAPCAMK